MKSNINLKHEKGITLVALIITIIVLIILAAVTIITLNQNKMVNVAINGTESYANSQQKEISIFDELSNKIDNALGEINGGFSSEQLKASIGKYVAYKPDNSTYTTKSVYTGTSSPTTFSTRDFKWRIWDVDGQNITLIADGLSNATLTINGAQGYNNAVSIINELCETCYSSKELKGIGRSINIKDIEGVLSIDPSTTTPVVIDGNIIYTYKNSAEWSGNKASYPYIHSLEEYSNIDGNEKAVGSGISRSAVEKNGGKYIYYESNESGSTNGIKTANTIRPTRTAWTRNTLASDFSTPTYYNMIFVNGITNNSFVPYYLASRCLDMSADWGTPLYAICWIS